MDKDCPSYTHTMYILSTKGLQAVNTDKSSKSSARGYYPTTGTSQGNTPFPTNWNASLGVLLRALHDIDPTPFLVQKDTILFPLENTAYADDLFSILARRKGLRSKADMFPA